MEEVNTVPALTLDEESLLQYLIPEDLQDIIDSGLHRRHFLKLISIAGGGFIASQLIGPELFVQTPAGSMAGISTASGIENGVNVSFQVNGSAKRLLVDSRMTLLDALRERMDLTGSKKGCDHGQCGACTVIVDGRRILSCLTLTATCEGKSVTTIEGLANGNDLHPLQAAFIKHDGFQCGYCTPGQICSAVALLNEAKGGEASYVTEDIRSVKAPVQLSDDEIRERMSGNICRCGCYPNIVAATREVHSGKDSSQIWQFPAGDSEAVFALNEKGGHNR